MALQVDLRGEEINFIHRQGCAIGFTVTPKSTMDWSGYSFSYDIEDSSGTSQLSATSDDSDIVVSGQNLILGVTNLELDVGSYKHSFKYWNNSDYKYELFWGDFKEKAGV